VIGFLRCIGLLNIAIWFGAGVFFTFFVGPAIFSKDMQRLLESYYQLYSGIMAQMVIARYFTLSIVCGIVAIIHLLAEQFYFGRAPQKRWLSLLVALLTLSLLGGCFLQPRMKDWHKLRYDAKTPAQTREAATRSFQVWHGVSQAGNLLMLVGLGFYLIRVANPPESMRFIGSGKFRS
jgi:Domain of unknown function (DUF4149)